MTDLVQKLLEDFVFLDCRLGDHPKVRAAVLWKERGRMVTAASTLSDTTYRIDLHCPGTPGVIAVPVSESTPFHRTEESHLRVALLSKATERMVTLASTLPNRTYHLDLSFQGPPSLIIVPLPLTGREQGVLSFDSSESGLFQERHFGLAQCLGALIAYAKLHIEPGVSTLSPIPIALGKGLQVVREEIGLTQADLADRLGTSRIAISRWEGGTQPPSKGPLLRWCEALGLLSPHTPTVVSLAEVSPDLLRMLQREPALLSKLSPHQFEQFVAERLDRMGFEVRLTGTLNKKDGGIDLIAVPRIAPSASFLLAGQVKHHAVQRKTGREAVDRLLAWKDSYFTIGMLVTNTNFTRDALWLASQDRHKGFLRLRNFEDLKRWIANNFWAENEWREIPDEIELAPGVTVVVPKPRIRNPIEIWPLRRLEDTEAGQNESAFEL